MNRRVTPTRVTRARPRPGWTDDDSSSPAAVQDTPMDTSMHATPSIDAANIDGPLDRLPVEPYIHDQELKNLSRAGSVMHDSGFETNSATSTTSSNGSASSRPHVGAGRTRRPVKASWSYVYVFFTNHIPFTSPNRSEPCLVC